jgi:hypothetical protein
LFKFFSSGQFKNIFNIPHQSGTFATI